MHLESGRVEFLGKYYIKDGRVGSRMGRVGLKMIAMIFFEVVPLVSYMVALRNLISRVVALVSYMVALINLTSRVVALV